LSAVVLRPPSNHRSYESPGIRDDIRAGIRAARDVDPSEQVGDLRDSSPIRRQLPAGVQIAHGYGVGKSRMPPERRAQKVREIESGRAAEREFPIQDRGELAGAVRALPKQEIRAVAIAMYEAGRPRPGRDLVAFPVYEFAQRRYQLRSEPRGARTGGKCMLQICQQSLA